MTFMTFIPWFNQLLLGGLEHEFYDFPYILGMSSSQLTNIFQRGRYTTNQVKWTNQSNQRKLKLAFFTGIF